MPIVGLSGIGGIGKTALASRIYAEDSTLEFERRLWLDVSGSPTFDVFLEAILLKLCGYSIDRLRGLNPQGRLNAAIAAASRLPGLLVVDNLESLLEGDRWRESEYEAFFGEWQLRVQHCKLLVTTQVRPQVWQGLPSWVALPGWSDREGATFLRTGGIVGTEDALQQFSQSLDGHPLALRLAAGFLRNYGASDLSQAEMLGLTQFEQVANASGLHRDRTDARLLWILAQHWERLSESNQQFLARLCTYRVPIDSELAAVMLDSWRHPLLLDCENFTVELVGLNSDYSHKAVLQEGLYSLASLVNRSLLRRLNGVWCQVEPLVARYVEMLGVEAAHERAIVAFEGRKLPREQWKVRTDILDHVELAHHYIQAGHLEQAFFVVRDEEFDSEAALETWLTRQGHRHTLIRIYSELLEAWEDKDSGYRAILSSLGNTYQAIGKVKLAINFHERLLAASMYSEARKEEAVARSGVGNAYYRLREYQRAINFYQQSLDINEELGDRLGEAIALGGLGNSSERTSE